MPYAYMGLSRDRNGNKVVKITFEDGIRGFSIQTNGSLPKTHNGNSVNRNEVINWVMTYGTLRQKKLFSEGVV